MGEPSIKVIWGLAKSPELSFSDEELHLLIQARTGKESMKKLTKHEISQMIGVLQNMKDSVNKKGRARKSTGNAGTENQRKKVYKLAEELGWDKPSRVNGMCKCMFNVSAVEWLNYQQCSKLIEALKKMAERQQEGKAYEAHN